MPFNPSGQFVGGQLMAAGIGRGMGNMAKMMAKKMERDREQAKKAKKMRGIAKSLQDELGFSDSEIENLPADYLAGQVEGYFSKKQLEKSNLEMQAMATEAKTARRQQRAWGRATEKMAAEYTPDFGLEMAMGEEPSLTSQEAIRIMAEEGVDPITMSRVMQGMSGLAYAERLNRQQNREALAPRMLKLDGQGVVYSPEGGQFQLMAPNAPLVASPIPGTSGGYQNIGGKVYPTRDVFGAGTMNEDLRLSVQSKLSKAKVQRDKLKALQDQKYTHATIDEIGEVLAPTWTRNDEPIADLLAQVEAAIKSYEEQLRTPQQVGAVNEYLQNSPEVQKIKKLELEGKVTKQEAQRRIYELVK